MTGLESPGSIVGGSEQQEQREMKHVVKIHILLHTLTNPISSSVPDCTHPSAGQDIFAVEAGARTISCTVIKQRTITALAGPL